MKIQQDQARGQDQASKDKIKAMYRVVEEMDKKLQRVTTERDQLKNEIDAMRK